MLNADLCRSCHTSMYDYTAVNIINWELLCDTYVIVTLDNGTSTTIRMRKAENSLIDTIVDSRRHLKCEKSNSRITAGD